MASLKEIGRIVVKTLSQPKLITRCFSCRVKLKDRHIFVDFT